MTEEQFLIDKIRDIQETAQREAQPYIDRLVYMQTMQHRVTVPAEWLANLGLVPLHADHLPTS